MRATDSCSLYHFSFLFVLFVRENGLWLVHVLYPDGDTSNGAFGGSSLDRTRAGDSDTLGDSPCDTRLQQPIVDRYFFNENMKLGIAFE